MRLLFINILKRNSEIYADRFRDKLISVFRLFATQPFLGRPAKNIAALRVYLLTKQNKIIYKVHDEEIVLSGY